MSTYITETTTTNDSYALIRVPKHGTSSFYYLSSASKEMSSFLRIGAVPDDDPSDDDGWDLVKLVVAFMDDTRTRKQDVGETPSTALTVLGSLSLDDGGTASVAAESAWSTISSAMATFYGKTSASLVTLDQEARVEESTKLHFRGGMRDHSDGNRISTTRGDKVEVIRGNYKMVVLGRRPDASSTVTTDCINTPVDSIDNSTTTWDASGGHIHDWRQTPGASTEYTYEKSPYENLADLPGNNDVTSTTAAPDDDSTTEYWTWRVKETTVKGDVEETTYGKVSEWFLGPSMYTQTGWENAPDTDGSYDGTNAKTRPTDTDSTVPQLFQDYPNLNRENPTITEKTWAKEIYDYTGSSDCRVDSILEETHTNTLDQTTDASGTISRTLNADELTENNLIDAVRREVGAPGRAMSASERWTGNFAELFLGGAESFKTGGLFLEARVAAKSTEANISYPFGKNTFNLGVAQINTIELTLGKYDIQTAALKFDCYNVTKYDEIGMDIVRITPVHTSRFLRCIFL